MEDPFDLGAAEPVAHPGVAPVFEYLDSLNPEQRRAVETLDGPALVLAGAGTGKTRVLTTRLAHMLNMRKAMPWQMLAVTFTNKAAREMQERVASLVGGAVEGMWIGTFHSISARILRRHAELVGLRSDFTILDDADQQRLIKQLLEAEGIDPKRWPPRALAAEIDGWKNKGLTPDKVQPGASGFADGKGAGLYKLYQDRMLILNACDFGDLLLHVTTILQKHSDVLADYHNQFRYIMVDEYQDTNVAQYLWLRLLAQGHRNICCVGDDDQSIYGWRGAEVGNILKFEQDFPGAAVIRLEQNYRSTSHILAAASGVIAHNEGRLGKTLRTDIGAGEKVRLSGVWDGGEEARNIAEEIEAYQRKNMPLSQVAILVRASFQMREFEERFIEIGMPYQVIGGQRFFQRQEVKDATSYLGVVYQPDNDIAFERIINTPRRGLGDKALQTLHATSRAARQSLYRSAIALCESDELTARTRNPLKKLLDDIERWRALKDQTDLMELAEIVLDESGYTEMWQRDKSPQAPTKLENLKEMVLGMENFDTLASYLEHVALVQANDESADTEKVSIMTLHAAKGLEFDVVFLPGWEEELFPNRRSLEESGNQALEEERRLAYVGITRARKHCHIFHAANRRVFNEWRSGLPSRFIEELPKEAIEDQTETGLYGGSAYSGGTSGYHRGRSQSGGHSGGGTQYVGNVPAGSGRGPGRGSVYDAPWQKATERLAQRGYRAGGYREPKTIDGSSRRVRKEPEGPSFNTGDRVVHAKFGEGEVRSISGNSVLIDFDDAGEKKVISAFIEHVK